VQKRIEKACESSIISTDLVGKGGRRLTRSHFGIHPAWRGSVRKHILLDLSEIKIFACDLTPW
jgi:hypothetical protein